METFQITVKTCASSALSGALAGMKVGELLYVSDTDILYLAKTQGGALDADIIQIPTIPVGDTGWSGTFTTHDGSVVSVSNGSITNIV